MQLHQLHQSQFLFLWTRFPGGLRGKPKLNFRLASRGMYTKCGSYAPTQFHLVGSKKYRNVQLEISYVDVPYVP
jgi:hypothetical protein